MCEAIYIVNTQTTFKKIMNGHLSNLLHLLKNGQKLYSFATHFEQRFGATMSHTDLRKYMMSKVEEQLKPIGTMETFTKPNCNLCIEECLTILKNLCEKCVTVMNKDSEIYGACRHKTTFHRFLLSTDDPVLTDERVMSYNKF